MGHNKSDLKALMGNTGALVILQLVNYAAPLLLIPYLTRILGVELYGVVAYGVAITQMACMVTDYGFNLSATYQIAKADGDKSKIDDIIGAVMACKGVLIVLVTAALAAYIAIDQKYTQYHAFFWLLLLAIVGQTFQPVWFFQGIEKMFYITLYSSLSRLSHLALVLLLVSDQQDYEWVAISNGLTQILATLIGLVALFRLGFRINWPGMRVVREIFRESTQFFWGRAAVSAYTAGGTLFLGLFSTPVQAAMYAAAEQLYRGAVMLIAPLHQALYPYMARTRDVKLFRKIFTVACVCAVVGLGIGLSIGPWVVQMIYGQQFKGAYPVLAVFMVIFTIVIPSSLLGYPFLAALGNSRAANESVIYGGGVQVFLLLLCYALNFRMASQTIFTVLMVEILVLGYRVCAANRLLKNEDQLK